MTFNPNAKIDSSKVSKRGRNTAIGVGAGGGLVLILALVGPLLGIDLSGLAPLLGGGAGTSQEITEGDLSHCDTGADANEDIECRMVGAATSLDAYWSAEMRSGYVTPGVVLFEQATQSGCGSASAATGPFYCPADQTMYLDTGFFDQLRNQFGASGGPLAEMYVLAHEWGHHMSNILGQMDNLNLRESGPTSDSVRLELQADCFAGAWAAAASTQPDSNGTTFLKPITKQQIADALNAAAAIGDDRIQEASGVNVNPHQWTHGSSEQRQRWFATGFEGGATVCDTFNTNNL
ncbi:MAG TPA: neutral zinc metallopeptidase [Terrimesophilobacter sp.]|nr:neutral zinc metallopeptidase [Terrimesophilobacter sp.]